MRSINPYIVGNPVKDQASFYGRQDIFREVMQVLHQRDSHAIVLYGQRRIGKTSTLLQLEQRLAREGEFTPIYFDLQDKAAKSLSEVLYELAQHISKITGHTLQQSTDFNTANDYFRSIFLPSITEKVASGGLVLLFDEFDVLDSPARTQASQAFFPYLRAWMENVQKVKFVFVIGRRPEELSVRTMATFKGIQSTRVSFMSQKDTEAVIRQSEQVGSLTWEPEAVARVYDLTHGHPFFTQLLCSMVLEKNYEDDEIQSVPTATADEVDKSVEQALKMGANAFAWLWDGLPPAERVVMSAMAEVKDEVITQDQLLETLNQSGVRLIARELELAPETLMDWELLYRVDNGYRFAVPLLRRWVLANRPLRRVKDELDRLDPLADGLFQTGQAFYNSNNLENADQQLRQALTINPNHLKARLLLGRIFLDQKKLAESVQVLDAAYQYDERASRADLLRSLLALAESQALEENRQLETCDRILTIQPDQPVARNIRQAIWTRRGDDAFEKGEFDQATKAYEAIGYQAGIDKVIATLRDQSWNDQLKQIEAGVAAQNWKEALSIYDKLAADFPEKQEVITSGRNRVHSQWRDERLQVIPALVEREQWDEIISTCEGLLIEFPEDSVITGHLDQARRQSGLMQKYHQALGALENGMRDQARKLFTEIVSDSPTFGRASLKLVEAMYGKVRISLTVPFGATLLAFLNSLSWTLVAMIFLANWPLRGILNGIKEYNGYASLYTENLLAFGLIAFPLVGMLFSAWANNTINVSYQIERGKPSYRTALWTHALFGMGLFYVAGETRRKWMYSIVALLIPLAMLAQVFYLIPLSEYGPSEEINFVSVFQLVLMGALIMHALSFIDVLLTCRQAQKKAVAAPRLVKEKLRSKEEPSQTQAVPPMGWRNAFLLWWPIILTALAWVVFLLHVAFFDGSIKVEVGVLLLAVALLMAGVPVTLLARMPMHSFRAWGHVIALPILNGIILVTTMLASSELIGRSTAYLSPSSLVDYLTLVMFISNSIILSFGLLISLVIANRRYGRHSFATWLIFNLAMCTAIGLGIGGGYGTSSGDVGVRVLPFTVLPFVGATLYYSFGEFAELSRWQRVAMNVSGILVFLTGSVISVILALDTSYFLSIFSTPATATITLIALAVEVIVILLYQFNLDQILAAFPGIRRRLTTSNRKST